jgi:hypothetical protein
MKRIVVSEPLHVFLGTVPLSQLCYNASDNAT